MKLTVNKLLVPPAARFEKPAPDSEKAPVPVAVPVSARPAVRFAPTSASKRFVSENVRVCRPAESFTEPKSSASVVSASGSGTPAKPGKEWSSTVPVKFTVCGESAAMPRPLVPAPLVENRISAAPDLAPAVLVSKPTTSAEPFVAPGSSRLIEPELVVTPVSVPNEASSFSEKPPGAVLVIERAWEKLPNDAPLITLPRPILPESTLAAAGFQTVPVIVTVCVAIACWARPLPLTAFVKSASVVVPVCTPAASPEPRPTRSVPEPLPPPAMPLAEPLAVKPAVVAEKPPVLRVSVKVALLGAAFASETAAVAAEPTRVLPTLTVWDDVALARL